MRILIFSTYFYPYLSGAVNIPVQLSRHLANRGNKVTVLTFKHDRLLKASDTINQVTVIRVNYLFKISKGFISWQLLFKGLPIINNSDLVLLNLPNFEGLIIAILAKIFRKKVVGIFICWVDLGRGFYNKIVNLFMDLSIRIQLLICSQIVPINFDYAQTYLKEYKGKISKAIFPPILKYISSPDYENKIRNENKDYFIIGFAGRTAKEKGIEFLLRALEKLNDPTVMLLIAGPAGEEVAGEGNYFRKIYRELADKKINYKFLGKLSDSQLGAFYNIIDLLVLPSVNKTEAFGIVQAEAMLAGKPVIASDLPGVRVPIKETGMGVLTEPGNSNEISKAIREIRLNYNSYTSAEKTAIANKLFKIDNFYNQWDEVLNLKKSE